MRNELTARGFRCIVHEVYASEPEEEDRLVQESSAIGDYDDALSRAGSSYLWIGSQHHLNREQVQELRDALTHWLDNGRLPTGISGGNDEQ